MVESMRDIVGSKTEHETCFYISSVSADAQRQGEAIRSHWGVEDSHHRSWTCCSATRRLTHRLCFPAPCRKRLPAMCLLAEKLARALAMRMRHSLNRCYCLRVNATVGIRPLIQRLIALVTELDKRAKAGAVSPRRKWRH